MIEQLVAIRLYRMEMELPYLTRRRCSVCNEKVGLPRISQKIYRQDPEVKIICDACAGLNAKD
jgi:hypothetical protein